MALLGNLVVVLVFAWVIRALLGAHGVSLGRLLVAVLVGAVLGMSVAYLLVVDVTAPLAVQIESFEAARQQVQATALPFQVVAAMVALVALELVTGRPGEVAIARGWRPWRMNLRWIGISLRGFRVARILARHGLAPALGLKRGDVPSRDPAELARRARLALEDAGGMFVKLGQLLASRPDLLPPEAIAELGRLHAGARPLERSEVEAAIAAELEGSIDTHFATIDWRPLGSASIAQVHVATTHDGREVVIKVRRPGLLEDVERDLAIALRLARIAERRTGWGATYEVGAIAEEFARTLRIELDLRVEARYAQESASAVADRPDIQVPGILDHLTTERLLVMDRLAGTPLSAIGTDPPEAAEARAMADSLCASQVEAMLRGERFHGDPHAGNVLLLEDGQLGLIDFGVTGRLDVFERSSVFQMLLALHLGEPSLLYESLVAVGAIPPTRSPDKIERDLARFMATHLGPGMPSADALTDLLRVTTQLGVRLPPQTATMFRALATLSGTLEQLSPGYPLIEQVAELAGHEARDRTAPASVDELLQREWAQLGPLVRRAPRHLDRIATLIEHGEIGARVRLFSDPRDVSVVERLVNRVVLTAIALGLCFVSVAAMAVDAGPSMVGTQMRLLEGLGWFGLFAGTVLLLRVLLDTLRPRRVDRSGHP